MNEKVLADYKHKKQNEVDAFGMFLNASIGHLRIIKQSIEAIARVRDELESENTDFMAYIEDDIKEYLAKYN